MDNLDNLLEAVCDEDTFLIFLHALSLDRTDEVSKEAVEPSNPYGSGANGWQHGSIEAFLEAAAAWGEDTKHRAHAEINSYSKPTNVWKRCAQIIDMGKHYE